MSCGACETEQAWPTGWYGMRIGNANVQIVGCEKHVGALMELARRGMGAPPRDPPPQPVKVIIE